MNVCIALHFTCTAQALPCIHRPTVLLLQCGHKLCRERIAVQPHNRILKFPLEHMRRSVTCALILHGPRWRTIVASKQHTGLCVRERHIVRQVEQVVLVAREHEHCHGLLDVSGSVATAVADARAVIDGRWAVAATVSSNHQR